jgi:hypothetical protein
MSSLPSPLLINDELFLKSYQSSTAIPSPSPAASVTTEVMDLATEEDSTVSLLCSALNLPLTVSQVLARAAPAHLPMQPMDASSNAPRTMSALFVHSRFIPLKLTVSRSTSPSLSATKCDLRARFSAHIWICCSHSLNSVLVISKYSDHL